MGDRPELIIPEYLSVKGLALYTTISIRTLREWIKSGMPHYRIGGLLRIKRSEFDEWVKKFRVEENYGNKVDRIVEEVMRDMGVPCRKRRVRKVPGHELAGRKDLSPGIRHDRPQF